MVGFRCAADVAAPETGVNVIEQGVGLPQPEVTPENSQPTLQPPPVVNAAAEPEPTLEPG